MKWKRLGLAAVAAGVAGNLPCSYAQENQSVKAAKSEIYPLVSDALLSSSDRVYFLRDEAFFSDGAQTTVLDSVTGKYKRTLKGVAYPLAVWNGNLFTVKNNYVSKVDLFTGKLTMQIGISKLGITRFTDAASNVMKQSDVVFLDFKFGNGLVLLSYSYGAPNYYHVTLAYDIDKKKKLWQRDSRTERDAPYGNISILKQYFSAQTGIDDVRYFDMKTGKNLSTSQISKVGDFVSLGDSGENDSFEGTTCFRNPSLTRSVICEKNNTRTSYEIISPKASGKPRFLVVTSTKR